jgi:class 3 adenylate cyclase
VVDTAGDGAFAVFPSAAIAADACITIEKLISAQNASYAREHQLIIRIGLHWGPALTASSPPTSACAARASIRSCSRAWPSRRN